MFIFTIDSKVCPKIQPMFTQIKKSNPVFKKNLVCVNSKRQFQSIISQKEENIQICNGIKYFDQIKGDNRAICSGENVHVQNQQEIIVPRCGKIEEGKVLKKKSKINFPISSHGYFRLSRDRILPNPAQYQPNSQNIEFVRNLKHTFKFQNKYKFSTRTFIDIIESCEHNVYCHKTICVNDSSEHILNHLSFNLPSSLIKTFTQIEKGNLNVLLIQVIDYWKKFKAQNRNFPLLRKYWPKSDISMAKYQYFVPYKRRFLEESKKKILSNQLNNTGLTQKEIKIGSFVKQTANFYEEVKVHAQIYLHQALKFKKQTSKIHNIALQHDLKVPTYLDDVLQGKEMRKHKQQLQKLNKTGNFKNPFVKFKFSTKNEVKLEFHTQYQITFDRKANKICLKTQFQKQSSNLNDLRARRRFSWGNESQKPRFRSIKNCYIQEKSFQRHKKIKFE